MAITCRFCHEAMSATTAHLCPAAVRALQAEKPTTVGTTEHLLWLDLETTGLDPATCGILEVAWAVTPLEITADLGDVRSALIWPGEVPWDDFAEEQHRGSGLTKAALANGDRTQAHENVILASLPPADGHTIYLAGSSIHFDRGFIRRHMPALEKRLHHRMLDVSAVVLARRAQGWTSPPSPDPKPHRAEVDLRASHVLLRAAMEGR
jgi:oligoribonuclease